MNSKLYAQIVDEIFMGIAIFDTQEHKCIALNKAAKDYLECNSGECLEYTLEDLVPAASPSFDKFRPFSKDLIQNEGLMQDVIIKKSSGRTFIADLGVRILKSESESHILLMFRDVTMQKKLQRDLTAKQSEIQNALAEILEQNKQLKELDRAKDKFVALTTHELRTPLSAMIATAEVLTMKLYDNEEQLHEFIKTIHTEGMHLLAIVNDILDFAKIQAGKMDFYIEEKDVYSFAKDELNKFTQMAEAKGVTLEIEGGKCNAYYDSLRFRQAMDNVINNAIKFTKNNSTVKIVIREIDSFACVDIHDEGPGIPAQEISKVFNEFETVGNVKTHHKGTGLGMPITKKLMENMGGQIVLESTLGKGSVFSLRIPTQKILAEEVYRSRPEYSDDLAA